MKDPQAYIGKKSAEAEFRFLRRNCFHVILKRYPACSSACPSAWRDWDRLCSVLWLMWPAFHSSSSCVPFCRCWACVLSFCAGTGRDTPNETSDNWRKKLSAKPPSWTWSPAISGRHKVRYQCLDIGMGMWTCVSCGNPSAGSALHSRRNCMVRTAHSMWWSVENTLRSDCTTNFRTRSWTRYRNWCAPSAANTCGIANIAPAPRERLLESISELSQRPDTPSLIYVTHHTEEILPVFSHSLLLRRGEIVNRSWF